MWSCMQLCVRLKYIYMKVFRISIMFSLYWNLYTQSLLPQINFYHSIFGIMKKFGCRNDTIYCSTCTCVFSIYILCSWFCCPLVLDLIHNTYFIVCNSWPGCRDEKYRHLITHWCVGEGSPVMVTKAELGVMKLRTEKSAEGALHNSHVQLYTPIGKTCSSKEHNSPEVTLIVSHIQSTSLRPCRARVHKTGRLET